MYNSLSCAEVNKLTTCQLGRRLESNEDEEANAGNVRVSGTSIVGEEEPAISARHINHAVEMTENVELGIADTTMADTAVKASTAPAPAPFDGKERAMAGVAMSNLSAPITSCTSLKTSTTQLPCYFTGGLSSLEIARWVYLLTCQQKPQNAITNNIVNYY